MSAASIARIKRRVAAHYGVEVNDLVSVRTARQVTRPRHVAMYLCGRLTPFSAAAIGKHFGGRDRTTVASAWRGIAARMAEDADLAAEIENLRTAIAAECTPGTAPDFARAVRGEARALRERAAALDHLADSIAAAEADG